MATIVLAAIVLLFIALAVAGLFAGGARAFLILLKVLLGGSDD